MWDTSKKLYILTRNVGHSIDILEKKFCFFCFCFSLCFVLLKRHKAMLSVQKSQHLENHASGPYSSSGDIKPSR